MSTKDKFIRACCGLMLVAIGPEALRAQHEGSRAAAVLRGDDGTDDGLDLDIRSTRAVQNTTATIRGKGLAIGQSGNGPARERAQAFLNAHAVALGIKDPGAGIARRVEVAVKREAPPEESGLELVHFQQLHNGIPVTGGELLVHLKGNRVVSVQSEVLVNTDVATTPKISANEALKRAEMVVRRIDSKARKPEYSEPRLELMNRGYSGGRRLPDTADMVRRSKHRAAARVYLDRCQHRRSRFEVQPASKRIESQNLFGGFNRHTAGAAHQE